METSALLKTHLFQTNLSRDSGLTSSDTQLYSEHMEPHAIPAADLQVRKKSLTRSTSQFDEVKPKHEEPAVLGGSYDSSLNVAREITGGIQQPVPPPRKSRRRAPDPPVDIEPFYGDKCRDVQSRENTNEKTTSNNAAENSKQRSSESIGSSVDDVAGSLESGDYPDGLQLNTVKMDTLQCNDCGELRKSASGAKIYLDEQLISDSSPSGNQRQSRSPPTVTNSSSLPSKQTDHKDTRKTPPPMREPPSYEESVLRTRGKAAEIRAKSVNRSSWSEHSPKHGQSNPANVHQQLRQDIHRSVDNLHTLHQRIEPDYPMDKYSSMQELHRDNNLKTEKDADVYGSQAVRSSEGTPQTLYSSPEPKHLTRDPVLKTLLAEGENKEEVMRKVRVGMTAKGGDIFPKHMRSIIRHSLHDDEFTSRSRSRGMRKTGSIDDGTSQMKPQRSESFATRQKPQLGRLGASRSVEKSASDTSVVEQFENNAKRHGWKRPSKPPTYQEAIQRKSLLKSGVPLYQVSHQDVKQQREKSSRAAQLYQESMKRYELQAEDPTQDRANEGHVPDASLESRAQRQPPPVRQADGPYRREPPPTRQIEHGSKMSREIEARRHQQQQQPLEAERIERREAVPSDKQRKHRDHHVTKDEARHYGSEPQRRHVTSQQTDQVHSSKVQRRGSDPRSRNANNNRNRRDQSSSKVSSSETESGRNQQGYSEESSGRREHTSRQQTSQQQPNNRERHGRRNKSRDQRLSDTRLDNNRMNEANRQNRSSLTRSKSDSSEHINKIGRFKELQALDSNIIEQYRKSMLNAENEALKDGQGFTRRRGSINSVRNRDWHRDLAEQYSNVFYMPPPETNNNKVIYAYAGREEVNAKIEMDEKPKRRWQPPVHPTKDLIVVNNNNNQAQERQNSVKKDKGRRSMPSNFTNWSTVESNQEQSVGSGKENKPIVNVAVQDWRDELASDVGFINVKERIKEYAPSRSERQTIDSAKPQDHYRASVPAHQQQHQTHAQSKAHTPKQSHVVQSQAAPYQHKEVDANRNVRPPLQRGSRVQSQRDSQGQQAHVQAQASPQQDVESEAGLTWSVAKLRNRFGQGNSSNIFYDPTNQQTEDNRQTRKKIAREATNANANEEYI